MTELVFLPYTGRAAAAGLAMTAIFMLSPFVAGMGNENSRHREERSDLHLFLSPQNADKLPRNADHAQITSRLVAQLHRVFDRFSIAKSAT